MNHDPTVLVLMYVVLPLWLAAGFLDWLCHRATHIEATSGAKESLIHFLMFAEVGIPLLAALFLQVNAGIISLMIIAFFIHDLTALWDVSYAVSARWVSPIEQHIHSFLEMVPLITVLLVISRHWGQFLALFGFGEEVPSFNVTWKREPLPVAYIIILALIFVFGLVPYAEELWRCIKRPSDEHTNFY
ncbi:diguanylate cyclase [Dyella monticola]|uniref:Diguanylate cyclase n=1 Tax=Dyella monticola TaxID=1927958 RepID=A0A370WTR6_9GAMM|nr:diguanylate cyclase [Dyella monticola]RDS79524.1 diguanylate cyclase [Dyella monticola]